MGLRDWFHKQAEGFRYERRMGALDQEVRQAHQELNTEIRRCQTTYLLDYEIHEIEARQQTFDRINDKRAELGMEPWSPGWRTSSPSPSPNPGANTIGAWFGRVFSGRTMESSRQAALARERSLINLSTLNTQDEGLLRQHREALRTEASEQQPSPQPERIQQRERQTAQPERVQTASVEQRAQPQPTQQIDAVQDAQAQRGQQVARRRQRMEQNQRQTQSEQRPQAFQEAHQQPEPQHEEPRQTESEEVRNAQQLRSQQVAQMQRASRQQAARQAAAPQTAARKPNIFQRIGREFQAFRLQYRLGRLQQNCTKVFQWGVEVKQKCAQDFNNLVIEKKGDLTMAERTMTNLPTMQFEKKHFVPMNDKVEALQNDLQRFLNTDLPQAVTNPTELDESKLVKMPLIPDNFSLGDGIGARLGKRFSGTLDTATNTDLDIPLTDRNLPAGKFAMAQMEIAVTVNDPGKQEVYKYADSREELDRHVQQQEAERLAKWNAANAEYQAQQAAVQAQPVSTQVEQTVPQVEHAEPHALSDTERAALEAEVAAELSDLQAGSPEPQAEQTATTEQTTSQAEQAEHQSERENVSFESFQQNELGTAPEELTQITDAKVHTAEKSM